MKKLFAAGAAMSLLFSTQPANAQCNAGGGPPFSVFEVKAGHYNDLGVNGGGVLWAIGANGVELIFQSYQTSGCRVPSNLFYPGGESTSNGGIASAPDGSAFAVTNANHLWRLALPSYPSCQWGSWQAYPGLAKDVAIAHDGTIWIIGTFSSGSGYAVYRWTGAAWQSVPGGGVRIAAGTGGFYDNGEPWVVNSSNTIFRRNPDGSWTTYPGKAYDIGIDGTGLPFVIGTYHASGSTAFVIYHFNGSAWVSDPNMPHPFGGAKITSGIQGSVTLGSCHIAYFIDDVGNIWWLQPTS